MKKILINFILLFSIIVPIVNCNAEPMVKKEFTENKDREWIEEKLNEELLKIEYDHYSIHFISTGRFGIYINNGRLTGHKDWVSNFYLKTAEKFYHESDHHSSIDYELLSFNENSLTLKYTSSFDHRSFGKNLITTDTGIINLKYK